MSRSTFSDGQELTYEDLNNISAGLDKTILDLILPNMVRGQSNKVFGAGLKVSRINATQIQVSAGMAIQTVAGLSVREPVRRIINLKNPSTLAIEVAHPTFSRKDIVVIKSALVESATGIRRFKDFNTDNYVNQTFVIEKDWGSEIAIVKGIEDGSNAIPAIPDGYIKLAEILVSAVNGIQNEAAIVDKRSRFSHLKYDAVVGSHSYCTHSNLGEALSDDEIEDGAQILVLSDQAITAPITISKANLEIEFAPKVTFTKAGATKALLISASGVRINKGRFVGFSGAGESGIEIQAGASHSVLFGSRFLNCTKNINDLGTNSTILAEITE